MVTITINLPFGGKSKKKGAPPPPPSKHRNGKTPPPPPPKPAHIRQASQENIVKRVHSGSYNNVYSKQGGSWQRGASSKPAKSYVPSKPAPNPKPVKSRWKPKASSSASWQKQSGKADNSWMKAKPHHAASTTSAWGRNTNNGKYSNERGKVYESDAKKLAGKEHREMEETFARLGSNPTSRETHTTTAWGQAPRSEQPYYRSNITNRSPAPAPPSGTTG